jgi:hypothetical protein
MHFKVKVSGQVVPPSGEIWSEQGYAAKVLRGREHQHIWRIEDNKLLFTAKKLFPIDMPLRAILGELMMQYEDAEWNLELIRCGL